MVTTYTADGKPTKPTITGLSGPGGIAVDKNGKMYVTNYYGNTLMTFTAAENRRLGRSAPDWGRPSAWRSTRLERFT